MVDAGLPERWRPAFLCVNVAMLKTMSAVCMYVVGHGCMFGSLIKRNERTQTQRHKP